MHAVYFYPIKIESSPTLLRDSACGDFAVRGLWYQRTYESVIVRGFKKGGPPYPPESFARISRLARGTEADPALFHNDSDTALRKASYMDKKSVLLKLEIIKGNSGRGK